MIGFQMSFIMFFSITYTLAMASTALAVLLGCAVEDPKLGQEMLPILFVPQMLFAGFFVAPDLIPAWLRWARYLCSLTYAVRISLVEEFYNCNPSNPRREQGLQHATYKRRRRPGRNLLELAGSLGSLRLLPSLGALRVAQEGYQVFLGVPLC